MVYLVFNLKYTVNYKLKLDSRFLPESLCGKMCKRTSLAIKN